MDNVKRSENVVCWYCQHFQRYDMSPQEPEMCIGECRLKTRGCSRLGVQLQNGSYGILERQYFPVIKDGSIEWCGDFTRTIEKNLPAMPPHTENGCEQGFLLPQDVDLFRANPKSKQLSKGYTDKPGPGSVACWSCDHFQPKDPIRSRAGFCHRYSPCSYEQGEDPLVYWMAGEYPEIDDGVCYWCSQWERARHNIAVPKDGWICNQPQNLNAEAKSIVADVLDKPAKKKK